MAQPPSVAQVNVDRASAMTEEFIEREFYRLPAALHFEVASGLKLAAFMTGVRAFIEQTVPGMMVWETEQYNDTPFVKITPSEMAKSNGDMFENAAIYYAATGQALIVTMNEDVLKRALDRQTARRTAKAQGEPLERTGRPWLGKNVCFQAEQKVVQLAEKVFAKDYQRMMQMLAWGNLPILNEWKRVHPDADPLQLHEQFWQRRLVCPGGGDYRWNKTWKTMESTFYEHYVLEIPVGSEEPIEVGEGMAGSRHRLHAVRSFVRHYKQPLKSGPNKGRDWVIVPAT